MIPLAYYSSDTPIRVNYIAGMESVLVPSCTPWNVGLSCFSCHSSPLCLSNAVACTFSKFVFTVISKMAERKAVIKNADMSEDMQQDAVECATQVRFIIYIVLATLIS